MGETQLRNPAGRGLSALGDALSNALCACIITYCIVSFFAGQAGMLAYRDMKSGIQQMNEKIVVLNEENAKLQDLRKALASNSDRIAQEARSIGYLRKDERMVIFSSSQPTTAEPSRSRENEPIRAGSSTGLPDLMIKILAAMTGLAVLLASLLMSSLPSRRGALRTTANRS